MHDLKPEKFSHRILDLLDTWITKLNHFSTINADQMIMLFETVRFFVLRQVFSKLMFCDEITQYQKFKCVVHCRATNPVI